MPKRTSAFIRGLKSAVTVSESLNFEITVNVLTFILSPGEETLRVGDSGQPRNKGHSGGKRLTWHRESLLSLPRIMGI